MRAFILVFALTGTRAFAGLELTNGTVAISKDPFSKFQWGLVNQGQTQIRDVPSDDLRTERVQGIAGYDLGVSVDADPLMKRDTVVALLDTGVDTTHEDLQGAFALNTPECAEGGKVPAFPRGDADGNGFKTDCLGWNFVTGSHRVEDQQGHGTHLAGLIAARAGNGKGIRGISNRVRVLPLTVMSGVGSGIGERVLKAMRYAILRKVDVINLSLGWPLSEESAELRAVFTEAIASGITVVAAAGNDGTAEPVYPCAYPGVICVGSSDLEGKMSADSNFGSQVDFLAPGEDILGTIPKTKYSTVFAIPGYDYLSGSSQAAAQVSGMLAVLKGIFPSENTSALYRRLAIGARMNPAVSSAFSLHGIPSLARAIEGGGNALVQPDLKEQSQLAFTLASGETSFELPLVNYGAATEVSVKVSSSSGAAAVSFTVSAGKIGAGAVKRVRVPVKIVNAAAGNQLELTIEVTAAGATHAYRHRFILTRTLAKSDAQTRLAIEGLKEDELDKVLPVQDPQFLLEGGVFYAAVPTEKGSRVALLRATEGKLAVVGRANLLGVETVLAVLAKDGNGDGKSDLLVFSEMKAPEDGGARQFAWFDTDLKPLFGAASLWNYSWKNSDHSALLPGLFSWIPARVNGLGKVLLPAQVMMAKGEVDGDVFGEGGARVAPHFVALVPSAQGKLSAQILDTPMIREKLMAKLGQDWRADLSIVLSAGTPASLLVSVKKGARVEMHQLDAPDLASWTAGMATNRALPALNYDWSSIGFADGKVSGTTIANQRSVAISQPFDQKRMRWAAWNPKQATAGAYTFTLGGTRDVLQKLSAVYETAPGTVSAYVLTDGYLRETTVSLAGAKERKIAIARFSYVPSELMNLLFYPFHAGTKEASAPAFFVNAKALNQNYVYVIRSERAGLVAPAELTVRIPEGCQALNPGYAGASKQSSLQLLCRKQGGAELIRIPVTTN